MDEFGHFFGFRFNNLQNDVHSYLIGGKLKGTQLLAPKKNQNYLPTT